MTEKDRARGLREQRSREPAKHPLLEAAVAVGAGDNEVRLAMFRDVQQLFSSGGVPLRDVGVDGCFDAMAKQVVGDIC